MRILLIHGLGRTPVSLWRLGRWLGRHGFNCESAGYVAAVEPLERIVARVARRMAALAGGGAYAVVGHSLGGLLARAALPRVAMPPRTMVMLGTPNRRPRLGARLAPTWPYRLLFGEAGQALASPAFFAALPRPATPYHLVAGTAGPRGRRSPFGTEPNDGVVALAEAPIMDDDAVLTLPVLHTFMMNDPAVRAAVLAALEEARP